MVFIWNLHRKVIRGGRESLFHWQFREWKRWGWAYYFAALYWTSIKTIDLLENDTFWISSQRNHIFKTKIKRIYYHKWMLPFPLFYRACDMWCFFITEMEQLHWATKSPLIHRLLARSPSKWVLLGRNKNMPVSLFLYLWSFFLGFVLVLCFLAWYHYMANFAPKARIGIRDISKNRNKKPFISRKQITTKWHQYFRISKTGGLFKNIAKGTTDPRVEFILPK